MQTNMYVSLTGWMRTTTSSLMESTSRMPYSLTPWRTDDCFPASSSSQTALVDRRYTTLIVIGRARKTAGYDTNKHTHTDGLSKHYRVADISENYISCQDKKIERHKSVKGEHQYVYVFVQACLHRYRQTFRARSVF